MAAITLLVTSAGLQLLGSDGTLTSLALPTGVTAVAGVAAQVANLANSLIVTGSVSQPLWIQPNLGVNILTIPKPNAAPVLSSGGSGSYTGTRRALVQFLVKDPSSGTVIGFSPLSDPSAAFTFTAQKQSATLPVSGHPSVNCRRLYFTANNGTDYFAATDIDDNVTTSITMDIADASLDIAAVDSTQYVSAPTDLSLVTVWKDRVWGKSALDNLVGSISGGVYSWPVLFPIDPRGSDGIGISGFIARRDQLGVCRRNNIWMLTGSDETNFSLVKLVEGKGCIAPASCIVVRDVGYFLSDDGIYSWDNWGVKCITDDTVRPWFTTDTYFNRQGFPNCFAGYDPVRNKILFVLPAAGSSPTTLNSWIELDLENSGIGGFYSTEASAQGKGKFFGPHTTSVVSSFSGATIAPDANNKLRLILGGSDGLCYAFSTSTFTDGASSPIAFAVKSKPHAGDSPDLMHVFLQPTVFTKAESGGQLTVTPYLGNINAPAGTAQQHDLTQERERLARLGAGRLCALEFTESTAGQDVELYGYLLPFTTLGRR